MQHSEESNTIAAGFAMFSMFFGAGNVIYPLAVGQYAQNLNFYAISGLLITAVLVPVLGLIASILFDGDYKEFFSRIGFVPGFLVSFAIMALIGPFGAIPRTLIIAYSTVEKFIPGISLNIFTIASCIIVFLLTFKRNSILDIIGYYLTPGLLISLGIILMVGLFTGPQPPLLSEEPQHVFIAGLIEGYNTMDLLATFFFASVVMVGLKADMGLSEEKHYKKLIKLSLKASMIGASLLAIIYVGFSYVTSFFSADLEDVAPQYLIAEVSNLLLGTYGGIVVSIAVALACLTTAIALSSVFAEFIHKDLTNNKVGYIPSLILTLIICYFFAIMNFTALMNLLKPILKVCYPSIILLSFLNILYKLYNFKPVKVPVYLMFAVSLIVYLYV